MNEDWRTRNTVSGSDALKAAAVILGLLFACIMIGWVVSRLLRSPPSAEPAPLPSESPR
jgi:hypothetical protein